MKILVDIDNVVVDFVTAMIAYLNVKYDKNFKVSDMVAWDFTDSPNIDITTEQFYQAYDDFMKLDLWDKAPIYSDANSVLNRLFEDHCVIYLSSRPPTAEKKTISCFTENGIPFNGFQVLRSEAQPTACGMINFCQGLSKGEIAKNWEADVAVEDKPSTIQSYINKGIMVVRKEEPYNELKYTGNLSLLRSSPNLTEFEKIVNQLEQGE